MQKGSKTKLLLVMVYASIIILMGGCAKKYSSCADCEPVLINGPLDITSSSSPNLVWASRFLRTMSNLSFMAVAAIDTSNNASVVDNGYVTFFNLYFNPFSSLSFFQTLGVSFTDGILWAEGIARSQSTGTDEAIITRYSQDGTKVNSFPIEYFGQLQVSPSTGYGWIAETLTDSAKLVAYDLAGSIVTQVALPYPTYGERISPDSTILVAMNISGATNCLSNDALIAVSQTGNIKGLYNLSYKVNAGFEITSDGSLWIGDACNNKIVKLNPDLSTIMDITLPFVPFIFTILPNSGEIVVVHDNTKISFLDQNGNNINSVDLGNYQIKNITSISYVPLSGHIFVGTSYMNNSSGKSLFDLDASGKVAASYSLPYNTNSYGYYQ